MPVAPSTDSKLIQFINYSKAIADCQNLDAAKTLFEKLSPETRNNLLNESILKSYSDKFAKCNTKTKDERQQLSKLIFNFKE